MDNAFDYIINKQKGGIDTEAAYPYRGEDERCEFESSEDGATISNWTDVPSGDEDALLDALATRDGSSGSGGARRTLSHERSRQQ